MIISGVLDGVLTMADQPSWFLLSKAGDSIVTVYGGYTVLLEQGTVHGIPPEALEAPDINLCIVAMVIYMVVCFLLSIWITRRRQLA
jgi:hypothetical protein